MAKKLTIPAYPRAMNPFDAACNICGCKSEYTESDIKIGLSPNKNVVSIWYDCPHCANRTSLFSNETDINVAFYRTSLGDHWGSQFSYKIPECRHSDCYQSACTHRPFIAKETDEVEE